MTIGIWLTPRLNASCDFLPGSDIRYVTVGLDSTLMTQITGNFLGQEAKVFRNILESRQDRLFFQYETMIRPMQVAAQQLF